MRKFVCSLPVNNYICALSENDGGLAQLARAFDWQSKGHRFDSDILHLKISKLKGPSSGLFCFYTHKYTHNPLDNEF